MTKISIFSDNLLLKKQEVKKSDFAVTGSTDMGSPLYEVAFCAKNNQSITSGDIVILKPGSYDNVSIDNVVYVYATNEDIVGAVK